MIGRKFIVATASAALAALALLSLMGPTGGFPSRPRFQTVTAVATASGTQHGFSSEAGTPAIQFVETDAAAENQRWRFRAAAEGFVLQTCSDAGVCSGDVMVVERTGTTVDSVALSATAITLNGVAASDFARLSQSNTFTGALHLLQSATPILRFDESDGASNERLWELNYSAGSLSLLTRTDAGVFGANALAIERTGTTVDSINLTATAIQANGVNIAPVRAFKAADTSTSSDTTVNADPDLVLAVAASSVRYKLEGFFKVLSASATPGFRLSCTVPSGAAAQFVVHLSNGAAAAQQDTNISCGQNDFTLAAGDRAMLQISGEILTSSTAGNFTIAWAQSTSNATATVLEQGSWLEIVRLN